MLLLSISNLSTLCVSLVIRIAASALVGNRIEYPSNQQDKTALAVMSDFKQDAPLVLIVDDEVLLRFQLKRALEQEGYRVAEALNGAQCLKAYQQLQPDLILLDALMPVMDGFTCCAKLKAFANQPAVPVMMVTGLDDAESIDRAFEAGATDYITKPVHWAVLRQRVRRLIQEFRLQQQQVLLYQQLEAANHMLQHLALIDGLTQVANRRRFNEYLEQTWQQMQQAQQPLSLILCDIDCFKAYNDTYGHQAGDLCLQQVAKLIEAIVEQPTALVARYGGEEFAIILPNTTAAAAAQIAAAICVEVKALQLAHVNSFVENHVTLSLGVASMIPNAEIAFAKLITAADRALYQAKAAGRDQVIAAL